MTNHQFKRAIKALPISLLIAAGLLFTPTLVIAKSAAGAIEKMDRDGDGKISKGEWKKKKKMFAMIDLDSDGYVTLEELQIRFGERTTETDSSVERPDQASMSAIRRAGFDDVQDLKDRGLIETGLYPVWEDDASCRGIDEWYAKDYSPKRPKESYHGGIDIPAPFGTPIYAAMDGEVVAIYEGKLNPRGIEVVMRHTPEESGLPLYIYTRYTHFNRMPEVKVGQHLKMGDLLGPTGNSGIQGCELTGKPCRKARRPAIHYDVLYSRDKRYFDTGTTLVPFDVYWMDPNALYRKKPPFDSFTLRGLLAEHKAIPIAYMFESGERVPPDTKMIWPYACKKISKTNATTSQSPWDVMGSGD
ncbi:MAG: peptidoglycan DD-metalloendopeptidase family protein [Candidatus Sedimenticola sp. (ex Thyasira tokunagai)]